MIKEANLFSHIKQSFSLILELHNNINIFLWSGIVSIKRPLFTNFDVTFVKNLSTFYSDSKK